MKNKIKNGKLHLNIFMCVCLAIIFALITLVIEPLYISCISNITLRVTVIPNALSVLLHLAEVLAFSVCYSIIIYTAHKSGTRSAFGVFGVYALACLVRRLCVLLISFIMYSSIYVDDVFSTAAAFVFECLLALIVTLVTTRMAASYGERQAKIKKAAAITGDLSSVTEIEFNSAFSKSNPLMMCSLVCACILTAYNLLSRIITDVTSEIGQISASTIVVMIAVYIFEILLGVILYTLCWLILSKIHSKDKN